ncbi:MAG: PHP domain-containing protein [Endozoicomonas sp. (ex Botrylloides leachii)]|nr:PHP domain-containing protein [Endozoicomonas sp. (ex Botrylloides leachii)]
METHTTLNLIDLHCHTTASDGSLSPIQLYERAHEHNITALAITDHDSVAGYEFLNAVNDLPAGPKLISGIELSTAWSGIEIHIVSLNFSLNNPDFKTIIQEQGRSRRQRALYIAERLAHKLNAYSAETLFNEVLAEAISVQQRPGSGFSLANTDIQVGRPHFANWLVNQGIVSNQQSAFKKYLGNNKLGDLKRFWPSMAQGVARMRALGAVPVLAHPMKYGMTRVKLQALINDFKLAGGQALEVVGCNVSNSQVQQLAGFCEDFDLKASQGSDFHSPNNPWVELGRFPPLPKQLTPVWDDW